jgi:tol-pal system protein YbgF
MMRNRKALILALGLWSMAATAQVPVVEAGGRNNQAQAGQADGNELLLSLYNQLESLQQEVQTLRGMVEEQANQLRRLQTDQRDRYIDVDRRLSELSAGGAAPPAVTPGVNPPTATLPGATVPPTSPGVVATPPLSDPGLSDTGTRQPQISNGTSNVVPLGGATTAPNAAPTGAPTADAQMNEQDLYRTALNLLLEQSQYDESIRLFQSYIDRFPQGRLLTNAYYWQGEALILVSRFEEARDGFMHIMTNYPEDPKAASAMLKLGVAYQRMGDRALAEQTWRDIATRYPENVPEIRAAQDYLNRQ